jgi:hypothetical protein
MSDLSPNYPCNLVAMWQSAHTLQILENAKGSKYPEGATMSANAMASFQ